MDVLSTEIIFRCQESDVIPVSMPTSTLVISPTSRALTMNSSIFARSKLSAEFSNVMSSVSTGLPSFEPMSLMLTVESVPPKRTSDVCTEILYRIFPLPPASGLSMTPSLFSFESQSSW